MNGDKSSQSAQKNWFKRIAQFLTGEMQDENELFTHLKEACDKHLLDTEALSMIEGVLQVSHMRVRDIMIPRVQMVVVPSDAELETVLPLIIDYAHSRFPVIEDDRSKVVGVLIATGGIDDDPNGTKGTKVNYVDKALTELTGGKPVSIAESTPYGCSVKY